MQTDPLQSLGLLSIYCNFHAQKLAEQVFGNPLMYYKGHQWREVHAKKLIPYVIGFHCKDRRNQIANCCLLNCSLSNTVIAQNPAIIHWVGTDIINAQAIWEWGERRMFEKLSHPNIVNLVHLDEHLEEMKVVMPDAHYEIVPMPPYQTFDVTPFNDKILQDIVSVYMPLQRQEFYRKSLIVAAAKKFPEVRFEFYFYNDDITTDEPIKGTVNCFRVPARDSDGMKSQISRSKLFLRIPYHDGLSVQVLEFATAGRSVIYNKKMPHIDYFEACDDNETNVARLSYLIGQALKREKPNQEMADYYRVYHSRDKYLSQMRRIVGELIPKLQEVTAA